MELHRRICDKEFEGKIKFSLDGVQTAKSSIVTTDVFSISFNNCRNVYPLRLIRPCNRYKYNEQFEIREVVNDINDTEVTIDSGICDNPKHSVIKNVKCHSATHPCEYCEEPAVIYTNVNLIREIKEKYITQRNSMKTQIKSLKDLPGSATQERDNNIRRLENALIKLENEEKAELKKSGKKQLVWPASTMNGRPRTITCIRRIVNDIEASEVDLDPNYVKGIKGRSVFLDQPDFDYILDFPCEHMHSVCLGVVKRMVELTYSVGENRPRITTRKRSDPQLYNKMIILVKVPREFPRRCRNLDFSVFKALEFRNLILFFFPIVIESIEPKFVKERQLWLNLTYVIRACIFPQTEFEKVNKKTIFDACELFYNLYEEVFGPKNCTYSVHVVGSHILKIRGNAPLSERPAFMFESYFAEFKNLFRPGTPSPLKQILKNTILKRTVEHHVCEKTVYYGTEGKNSENNHSIYTVENGKFRLYNIIEVDGNIYTCQSQGKFQYTNDLTPNYNWSDVGVFKLGPIGNDLFQIKKEDICGKVLLVNNLLILCPINVLQEK